MRWLILSEKNRDTNSLSHFWSASCSAMQFCDKLKIANFSPAFLARMPYRDSQAEREGGGYKYQFEIKWIYQTAPEIRVENNKKSKKNRRRNAENGERLLFAGTRKAKNLFLMSITINHLVIGVPGAHTDRDNRPLPGAACRGFCKVRHEQEECSDGARRRILVVRHERLGLGWSEADNNREEGSSFCRENSTRAHCSQRVHSHPALHQSTRLHRAVGANYHPTFPALPSPPLLRVSSHALVRKFNFGLIIKLSGSVIEL